LIYWKLWFVVFSYLVLMIKWHGPRVLQANTSWHRFFFRFIFFFNLIIRHYFFFLYIYKKLGLMIFLAFFFYPVISISWLDLCVRRVDLCVRRVDLYGLGSLFDLKLLYFLIFLYDLFFYSISSFNIWLVENWALCFF
jgi:hypothetical protein